MADQVVEIVRLYVGRGLRADPFGEDDEKLELSVNLLDLGPELDRSDARLRGRSPAGSGCR